MILINLLGDGRLGNALFLIAAGLYVSKQLNIKLAVKVSNNVIENYYTQEIFPFEFFNNFQCLPLNYDISKLKIIKNTNIYKSYLDFPIEDNLLISGWFLGKNYVHYETIKDVFVPSKKLKEEIFDLYNPTRNTLMINIRRGDFLNEKVIKGGWHSEPKEYWKNAYNYLNKKYDKVLVTSDDLNWCETNLDFCDNIIFINKPVENPKIFFDLFLPTFVGDNIISAGTFSWWGAYLNQTPNKQVIMPYPWNTLKNNWRNNAYYLDNTIKFDIYNYTKI